MNKPEGEPKQRRHFHALYKSVPLKLVCDFYFLLCRVRCHGVGLRPRGSYKYLFYYLKWFPLLFDFWLLKIDGHQPFFKVLRPFGLCVTEPAPCPLLVDNGPRLYLWVLALLPLFLLWCLFHEIT